MRVSFMCSIETFPAGKSVRPTHDMSHPAAPHPTTPPPHPKHTPAPSGRYLEIFGRKNNLRDFWVTVGNEVTGQVGAHTNSFPYRKILFPEEYARSLCLKGASGWEQGRSGCGCGQPCSLLAACGR